MDALPNATFPGEEAASPNAGVTTDIIPDAKCVKTGASVEYIPSADKQWYVLRTTYGREDIASDYIIGQGYYVYVPRQRTIRRDSEGKKHKVIRVLTPNIIFAYLTEKNADKFVHHTPALSFLNYYYNHFKTGINFHNPPLTVPSRQMLNFIRATSSGSEHLRSVSQAECRYRDNALVRITDGEFKGVEGRLARIGGQQRVVVSLANGVINIATAYIPSAFIKVIDNQ